MKLLLHACCGPCSLEPVRSLRERGIEPHIYYANPNIHPRKEYELRRDTLLTWASGEDIAVTEGEWDVEAWERSAGVIGDAALRRAQETASAADAPGATEVSLTGLTPSDTEASGLPTDGPAEAPGRFRDTDPDARRARCRACYRLRFTEGARYAAEHGFDAIGTTLSVSPYQYTDVIREELERAAAAYNVRALFEDYRPFYDAATKRSREAGMYRQNYCGCRFSAAEAAEERRERQAQRAAEKARRDEELAPKRAREAAEREARTTERRAYESKRARQRAVLKALREQRRTGPDTGRDVG